MLKEYHFVYIELYIVSPTKQKHPFLNIYYKYPANYQNISNTMIFPFIKIKSNIKKEFAKFVKDITGKNLKLKVLGK